MKRLPVIGSCEGCGACCREQYSPPGYVALLSGVGWPDEEDAARFAALPEEARRSLEEYLANRIRGGRHIDEPACIWLDLETKACRFYEHRPNICRVLKLGGRPCRRWRKEYGVA